MASQEAAYYSHVYVIASQALASVEFPSPAYSPAVVCHHDGVCSILLGLSVGHKTALSAARLGLLAHQLALPPLPYSNSLRKITMLIALSSGRYFLPPDFFSD